MTCQKNCFKFLSRKDNVIDIRVGEKKLLQNPIPKAINQVLADFAKSWAAGLIGRILGYQLLCSFQS
jgi:hypothetical protein